MAETFGEMLDTSGPARRFYFERLASMSAAERLAMMSASCRHVRSLAVAGIHREHPDASPEELRVRLAVRLYGREVVERVLGSVPGDAR